MNTTVETSTASSYRGWSRKVGGPSPVCVAARRNHTPKVKTLNRAATAHHWPSNRAETQTTPAPEPLRRVGPLGHWFEHGYSVRGRRAPYSQAERAQLARRQRCRHQQRRSIRVELLYAFRCNEFVVFSLTHACVPTKVLPPPTPTCYAALHSLSSLSFRFRFGACNLLSRLPRAYHCDAQFARGAVRLPSQLWPLALNGNGAVNRAFPGRL